MSKDSLHLTAYTRNCQEDGEDVKNELQLSMMLRILVIWIWKKKK